MRNVTFGLLALAVPVLANAQTTAALEEAFLKGCTAAGNEVSDCNCIVQHWAADLSPEDLPFAIAAVEMSYQSKVPDPNTINQVMPLIMGMTEYTMRCAAGDLVATGLTPRLEISMTGDDKEEALLLERMTNGEASITEMMRYDELVMERREDERQASLAKSQAADARAVAARSELREAYQAELRRIHSRPVADWPVAEFETLFGLYCRVGGATDATCGCGWEQVTDLSHSYALPYLASRSEGDDVLERLSSADLYGTFPALSLLSEKRAQCDDL